VPPSIHFIVVLNTAGLLILPLPINITMDFEKFLADKIINVLTNKKMEEKKIRQGCLPNELEYF
jgi:hypothetical protein